MPTGRGQFVSDITPAQYDEVLASLYRIQRKYDRRMLVNAKCAPHYIKTVLENAHRRLERVGDLIREADGASERLAPSAGLSRSGPTPAAPAGARRARTTWGSGRTAMSPRALPPGLRGDLRSASLADLWTSSELFTDIRRRTSLGGRCGDCEMNGHCGGCRARAYGMTGDLMAEDPLCTHTPGTFAGSPLLAIRGRTRRAGEAGISTIHYGPNRRRRSRGTMRPPRA